MNLLQTVAAFFESFEIKLFAVSWYFKQRNNVHVFVFKQVAGMVHSAWSLDLIVINYTFCGYQSSMYMRHTTALSTALVNHT